MMAIGSRPRTTTLASFFPSLALLATLFLGSCSNKDDSPSAPAPTTITGRVVHADDPNRGVPDVYVSVVGRSFTTRTNADGWFVLDVSVTNSETLQLALSKSGFDEAVTSVTIQEGRSNTLPGTVKLFASGPSGGGTSGPASSVVLKSSSAASIGVRHAGNNESAILTYEVRDAQGRPVDFSHRATLQFTLTQMAGGGATVGPDTVSTDALGQAKVALNSGTLAQSVQVRARVIDTEIWADPVRVAIHGGLPDPDHFSFAVENVNVEGIKRFGITNRVTAFVGDRYGNPVVPGTVVYFTTTGGIIEGSALTDGHGRASVDLITAEPLPNRFPAISDSASVARIRIQTVGEDQTPIARSARAVLFSGHTELIVLPTSFDVGLNGSQEFVVNVWDQEHHNPLTEGTVITFATTVGGVAEEASFVLPDTRDRDFTEFRFRLVNPQSGPAIVTSRGIFALKPVAGSAVQAAGTGMAAAAREPAKVTVSVTSRNDNARVFVHGFVERP